MQISLSTPSCGWSNMYIEDDHGNSFSGSISYITDAANDILDAACVFLTQGVETSVYFDEEGTEWTLIFNTSFVKVHAEREENEAYTFFITARELIYKLCKDIYEEADAWAMWLYMGKETKEQYLKDRFILKAKAQSLIMMIEQSKRK